MGVLLLLHISVWDVLSNLGWVLYYYIMYLFLMG